MNKERLIELIQESSKITLNIALSSPGDKEQHIETADLNDFVLDKDGTLELWCNSGYEI